MAKGNMFQGMARGKIGDVVFSRLNGQQVSRVRNRNPRNPRTNAQLVTRAVMATVMQAYSAGKEIFNHSFQGESVGAHNMNKFMKMNADKLRSELASNLANTPISIENPVGRFVGPGSNTPTPYSYIVSDGGYAQTLFAFDGANNVFKIAAPTSGEKVNAYAARLGLIAGDIYTIVAFVPTSTTPAFVGPGEGGLVVNQAINVVYPTQFRFCRLMVKSGLASVEDELTTYSQLFESDPLNMYMTDLTQIAITATLNLATLAGGSIATTIGGTMGIIRSRRDQDVRSHTELEFIPGELSATPYPWGLTYDYLLDAWTMGATKVGDSSLLLEGQGFSSMPTQTRLPALTAANIAAITEGSFLFGVVMGTFVADGVAYTNPVIAIKNMNSTHPAVVNTVTDVEDSYQWSADIYGNLSLGTHDPGEALAAVVAPYLAAMFPSSSLEAGALVGLDEPTLVFSI